MTALEVSKPFLLRKEKKAVAMTEHWSFLESLQSMQLGTLRRC